MRVRWPPVALTVAVVGCARGTARLPEGDGRHFRVLYLDLTATVVVLGNIIIAVHIIDF